MRRCIYCLESKPDSDFNREHVVPEAFGRFLHGLVVDCVCENCNSHFGRQLDLKLGRDTMEGFIRFTHGRKPAREYKSFGRRATTKVKVVGQGPLCGLPVLQREVRGSMGSEPRPAIGYSQSEREGYTWFAPEDFPTLTELRTRLPAGGSPNLYLQHWGMEPEAARQRLVELGYPEPTYLEAPELPAKVRTETTFVISHPEFRAMSKIAFNYFAFTAGTGMALQPDFNETRRYVRDGVCIGRPPVTVRRVGRAHPRHYLRVFRHEQGVTALVSLFGVLEYTVELSRIPFVTLFEFGGGHEFDLVSRTARRAI